MNNNELRHYGVLGMKWGVRRFQNKDGSLTPRGKKRVSKEYKKLSEAVGNDLQKNYNKWYVETHNKVADVMNERGFNEKNMNKMYDKLFDKYWNETLDNFYSTDENVKKAKQMVDEYGMREWSDVAKENMSVIEDVRRAVEKNTKKGNQIMRNCNYSDELAHYGILGMKWGVRRYQNKDGSLTLQGRRRYGETNSRTLKKGTEIQNISRSKLDPSNKKSNRIYGAYTDSDKNEYVDMMGNFEYNGRGYKNTFVVKKDLKIASEKEVVKTISEMFREDPKGLANMMAKAYNAVNVPMFFKKKGKGFERKLSHLLKDPDSQKSIRIGREFVQTIPMTNKTAGIANDFYGRMVRKGFDAVLDTNDAYNPFSASQDPLIIFNMKNLSEVRSVKLTKADLEAAANYVYSREFNAKKKDVSSMAHSQHLQALL